MLASAVNDFDIIAKNEGHFLLLLTESDQETMLKTVKEVWIYKKNSQPLNTKNAGCIFKNPRGMSAGAFDFLEKPLSLAVRKKCGCPGR